jgi:hypothetical protein
MHLYFPKQPGHERDCCAGRTDHDHLETLDSFDSFFPSSDRFCFQKPDDCPDDAQNRSRSREPFDQRRADDRETSDINQVFPLLTHLPAQYPPLPICSA